MKIKCLHGFFIFEETSSGQVGDFISLTGLKLAPWRSAFTFQALQAAPRYVLAGRPLLGTPAIATAEGEPWDVFAANQFVYNFSTGLLVPIATITTATQITAAGPVYFSPGLIQPGSINTSGARVRDFSGWYSRNTQRWIYSEVTYV